MRRYISNRDLTVTLDRLVYNADPTLIKIYAQLYCYKENPQDKKLSEIGKVLEHPRKLALSVINAICTILLLFLIPLCLQRLAPDWMLVSGSLTSAALLVLFIASGVHHFKQVLSYSDYIMVDELMERGIIRLRKD